MKKTILYCLAIPITLFSFHACGPGEEEIQQQEEAREQARQDSLQQVQEAELEQQRQDSLEQAQLQAQRAEAQNIARQEEEQQTERIEPAEPEITYDDNGSFAVQVRSWRSEQRAREHVETWKEQGFEHVYIVKYGNDETGDVWFRVRIGNVATRSMAEQLQSLLNDSYQTESWIANTSSDEETGGSER